jgi:GNAT superfamily N-acetyltransferase
VVGPVVRPATVADVDELVRLRVVMLRAMGEAFDEAGDRAGWREAYATALAEMMTTGTTAAFVADDPGATAAPGGPGAPLVACGLVTLWRNVPGPRTTNGWRGHLASMVTEPEWRRRGLARTILGELLTWCETRGARRVDLHATPDGAPLYAALGFTTDHRFPEMTWRAAPSWP